MQQQKVANPRPTMTTREAAQFLNRSPRTLRGWACGVAVAPVGVKPVRVGRMLHWPVDQLRKALEPEK